MPASQEHVGPGTPLGATLVADGAVFCAWAPGATAVHVALHGPGRPAPGEWRASDESLLVRRGDRWAGFFPGVDEGTPYRFWTAGPGGDGYHRDPRARELELREDPPACLVRGPDDYPWHDGGFRPPPFHELILYQLHIGVFYAVRDGRDVRPRRVSKFLDVLDRLEYLAALGVNAIQPLPVVEWQGTRSRGYNNTDFFSPEMDYALDPEELPPYLERVNALLRKKGRSELRAENLHSQVNQLKAMVDLCHVYGIAVIADVVYNHAGSPFGEESMRFFDEPAAQGGEDADQYFIAGMGWAGGRIFDYREPEVRQFIIDNARLLLDEYHVDGFRYDEARVIRNNDGAGFLRDLTATLRYHRPGAIQIAEWWDGDRATPVLQDERGLGFDAAMDDRFRIAMRDVLRAASRGQGEYVELDRLKESLDVPPAYPAAWRASTHLENHDLVDEDREKKEEIQPRIPALANPADPRGWYARSRSRVATALLLTTRGIPMLFMGQEFLERKPWHNNPDEAEWLISWAGVDEPGPKGDFLRFTRDLVWLRRRLPALCGEELRVFHLHSGNRVIAYHRWLEGEGRDVVVAASLNESSWYGYRIGFPWPGRWTEVFNSDFYDGLPNPQVVGNGGGVTADGPPLHDFGFSAAITIPANGVVVFVRE
ncbi:MAG TPA: alpha-amylase family glycosyl hydrolase [Longimicrobium sp.]|nr:alpha-amylase family glycosyl hydrolase [Longimicrobium sp.]